MGGQDLADAAIEALDHAVGLWVSGLDEPMFNAVLDTGLVEGVSSGRLSFAARAEAIGELLAVVGEDARDSEGSGFEQALQEALGGGSGFVPKQLHIDPARGTVDGGEPILAFGLPGHLRQVTSHRHGQSPVHSL